MILYKLGKKNKTDSNVWNQGYAFIPNVIEITASAENLFFILFKWNAP